MEIKYKNNIYDLDIDTLSVVNGHHIYDFGEPKFEVLGAIVKKYNRNNCS